MDYHQPVLLAESVEGLVTRPEGVYVDATFGGGGHSRAILDKLDDKGHLFVFDQDDDARRNVWEDPRLTFVASNFRFISEYMKYYGVKAIDGVLADLGVSSWQFDNPKRGFSYREDHLLDMRMNRSQEQTAADIINKYSAKQLKFLFQEYGQVRNTKTLVETITAERQSNEIATIAQFLDVIGPCIRGSRPRYLAQVFQALRIEVNDEMGALEQFLDSSTDLLAPGGRLVVISYHSVEDQLVKRWMKTGNAKGRPDKDEYGRIHRPLKMLTKKPVVPTTDEIQENSRARSAKLRIAEKQNNEH